MYDIIIIGAGVSGIFTALSLAETTKKVLLLEAGPNLQERKNEHTFDGFGGLGISEGKYNYSSEFGGNLVEKIGLEQTKISLKQVRKLLEKFGGEESLIYQTNPPALQVQDFHFIKNTTQHLGRKLSKEVYQNFFDYLKTKITIQTDQKVDQISPFENIYQVKTQENTIFYGKKIVVAVGQANHFLTQVRKTLHLTAENTRIDLGLRLEMPQQQWKKLLGNQQEIKFTYKNFYSHCMNKSGRVISQEQKGFLRPDGQNFRENGASENLNFSLFHPFYFENEKQANLSIQHLFSLFNKNGKIIGQRLSELDSTFPATTNVEATLPYQPHSLKKVVPQKIIQGTLACLKNLENLLGEKISGNTVLYACDAKFYPTAVQTNAHFESSAKNIYFTGDCSGISWSLSHAAAAGLYLGEFLAK
ncbi:FAD-binding protein [Lactococcus nasutitermitis]|uniref:FAD-binding protein n=1 Tax=Lactococcus nasutitermitis TaxID=1652957 RepID=A0ABV9JCS5_9LACT|nr:NAD(P)/FAD-dependent oxidoreductase [Lactococcus nasutitermitis]